MISWITKTKGKRGEIGIDYNDMQQQEPKQNNKYKGTEKMNIKMDLHGENKYKFHKANKKINEDIRINYLKLHTLISIYENQRIMFQDMTKSVLKIKTEA